MLQLHDIDRLPHDPDALREVIRTLWAESDQKQRNIIDLTSTIEKYKQENAWLREVIAARNRRLFGRKSEKLTDKELQAWLFNEAELGALAKKPAAEEKVETITYTVTRRRKKGRKAISADLPRKIIEHDLPEDAKRCTSCGKERPRLTPDVSEELEYIPARIFVNCHVHHKYGPCTCGKTDEGKPIISGGREPRILPGSIASPSLLSHLAVSKFCDGLPFYRLEKMFGRLGVEYTRATMCNQMIGLSRALQPLLELMWEDVRRGPVIRMDETRLQVLHEHGREAEQQSWMHVALGETAEGKIILYHYHTTRDHSVPERILSGWSGYLQTDGLAAYHSAAECPGIVHVGCWAHVRRKFIDARGGPKAPPGGLADEALALIRRLFMIERELREKELADEEFAAQRRMRVEPVFAELEVWLETHLAKIAPQSMLFEAMRYMRNEWEKLIRYPDHPWLRPDNNMVENAIRPFVVGRKNWLFANTPLGAHASATLYSFIETAKANGLEPYAYMRRLFQVLPATHKEKLCDLLPYRINRQLLDLPMTG